MTKNYVSINALSSDERKQLKNAISEVNDAMMRASAERDVQKDIIKDISERLGLDKKLVRRMANTYYKSNFNNEVEDNRLFEEFYTVVFTSPISGA